VRGPPIEDHVTTNLSGLLLPLLLLLVAFMFVSQRRRQRAAAELQSALEVGSEVCTTSGLYGVITALDETVAHLQVAPGTVVRFDRRAVALAVTSANQAQTSYGESSSDESDRPPLSPPISPVTPSSPSSPSSPTDKK